MAGPLNVNLTATSNVLFHNVNNFTTSYHNRSWLQSFIVTKKLVYFRNNRLPLPQPSAALLPTATRPQNERRLYIYPAPPPKTVAHYRKLDQHLDAIEIFATSSHKKTGVGATGYVVIAPDIVIIAITNFVHTI